MDPKTPPPRAVSLLHEELSSPPEGYTHSPSLFHTPLGRDTVSDARYPKTMLKPPNETQLVTPSKPTAIPATPQSTLESSDGSLLRTPAGNFAPWNGDSPDILSTPTPIGIFGSAKLSSELDDEPYTRSRLVITHSKPDMEKPIPIMSVGATEESHHQMRKSPTGLEEENDLLQAPTGSAKLVIKERNPGSTSREDQTRTEDAEDMDTQRQPSKAVTIPNSILEWLDSPAHRRRPILQPELDQNMNKKELLRRRLAIFSYHDALSYKTLYPIDHPLGRVVRPREKENYEENPYEIDGWPDDSLSWTPPPLAQETEVRKRQEELRLIERYLDSESDSEEGSVDERLHANDPANAKLALRVKKSSRAWLANKAVPARSPMPTPPKPRTPPKGPKRTRASSVSETEPPVEMEVDRVDDEDSDEIACICKGVDDGRPMVQCDNCHTWHHVDCVGKTEEELPDKWFCWKCPMETAPERATNVQEPTLVQSANDFSPGVQYRSAANIPLYQGNPTLETSPSLASPLKSQKNSSIFEGVSHLAYGQRTPPSGASLSRYPYPPWSEEMSRQDDDPLTAMASTAFGGSTFTPSPFPQFDEMAFGSLSASPSRIVGPKFSQVSPSATPKKERPWTNYIGTYSTPGASTPGFNPFVQQSSIQADPLFIHYEHDAPKQTAHHGPKGRKRGKGREKEKEATKGNTESKEDALSAPTSAQSEDSPNREETAYENEHSLSSEENTDGLEPSFNGTAA